MGLWSGFDELKMTVKKAFEGSKKRKEKLKKPTVPMRRNRFPQIERGCTSS